MGIKNGDLFIANPNNYAVIIEKNGNGQFLSVLPKNSIDKTEEQEISEVAELINTEGLKLDSVENVEFYKAYYQKIVQHNKDSGKHVHISALPVCCLKKPEVIPEFVLQFANLSADPIANIENLSVPSPISVSNEVKNEKIEIDTSEGKKAFLKVKKLGSGNAGTVFLVSDESHKKFAMKVPHVFDVPNSDLEFTIGTKCGHPNIMRVSPIAKPSQQGCLILELINGGDLVKYLATRPSFPKLLKLAEQLIDASMHMIERNVLPWDLLSLKNLMVDEQGNLKLIDFGSYFHLSDEEGKLINDDPLRNEHWCMFRGSLGDITGAVIKILAPYKHLLKDSEFYKTIYEPTIWMITLRPNWWRFPSLDNGTTVYGDCPAHEKKAYAIAFLKELNLKLSTLQEFK